MADQKRSSKAATAALVPILNAKGTATLPPEQIAAQSIVRKDLVRLDSLY